MSAVTPGEVLQPLDELTWRPIVAGIEFKLLFASGETGRWTVLFRCEPGSSFPRHKHYGAGEYFVVRGRMEYRMGSAGAGTYGYEPLGVVHDRTTFPEYTELLFTNFGPVAFLDDADGITAMLDHVHLEHLVTADLRP